MSIAQEPVGWFQGSKNANLRLRGNAKKTQHKKVSWPSRDAELMQLQMEKFRRPQSTAVDAEISRILKDRDDIEAVFQNLINTLVSDERERRPLFEKKGYVENLDCHHDVVEAFDTICIDINKYDYALKYVYLLNNLCTKFNDSAKIIKAMQTACSKTSSRFL
ncbi:hypothetical protein OSTOST_25287 [Ostertagia ostertagi]